MLRYNHHLIFLQRQTISLPLVALDSNKSKFRSLSREFLRGSLYTLHTGSKVTIDLNYEIFLVQTTSGDALYVLTRLAPILRMDAAYSPASPQKYDGNQLAKILHRYIFKIVMCMRSAIPFNA